MAEQTIPAPLVDAAARASIEVDLDATLFVEAGAGTGKTTTLVSRVVELVARRGVALRDIAAITFTEAAAGELRRRVEQGLEAARRVEPDNRELCEALLSVDDAAMTTIHAFAQRLLVEHPIAAHLPLRISVMDEISQALEFEDRFGAVYDELAQDAQGGALLVAARALGIDADHLRALARLFDEQWDRWKGRAGEAAGDAIETCDVRDVVERAVKDMERSIADLAPLASRCNDPDDRLFVQLVSFASPPAPRSQDSDWLERLRWLLELPTTSPQGKKTSWAEGAIDEARDAADACRKTRLAGVAAIVDAVLSALGRRLARAAVAAADARRRRGELRYHDLLVLTRELLESSSAVRAKVHGRYKRILVDEFQDTDPVQYDIVRLLGSSASGELEAGRLFFVGDPKQSIYRFRGADVGRYQQALEEVASNGPVRLVANFRSVPGVLSWVNAVFEQAAAGTGSNVYFATKSALVAARPPLEGGPPVLVLGGPTAKRSAAQRRREETNDVAAAICEAVANWSVEDDGARRPARFGDVAILVPNRNGLEELKSSLTAWEVPYRLATATLVYAAPEVRDVLSCLRCLAAPSDAPSVLAALRSPLFGCADDELLAFHEAGGQWRLDAPTPGDLDGTHPVVRSLAALCDLGQCCRRDGVLATLRRLVDERGALRIAAAGREGPTRVRHLTFLLDQARAFVGSGRRSLSELLEWMDLQAEAKVRAAETLPVEPGDDEVAVMTIHGAKGLEFPITVVCELGGAIRSAVSGPTVLGRTDGTFELQVRKDRRTAGFEEAIVSEDDLASEERLRLCYVAATRARDHLVVALHHDEDVPSLAKLLYGPAADHPELARHEIGLAKQRAAAVLAPGHTGPSHTELSHTEPSHTELSHTEPGHTEPVAPVTARAALGPAFDRTGYRAWLERRAALQLATDRPFSLAATTLGEHEIIAGRASGTGRRPRRLADERVLDGSLEEQRRGATALGRAVHGVLQLIDLQSGVDLSSLVEQSAREEGCPELSATVEALVAGALRTPVVVAAVSSKRFWRELPFAVDIEATTLEGIVDLCFLTADGLVIVDYKTDPLDAGEDGASLALRHGAQLGAYALGLATILDEPVAACVVVVLSESGAVEHDLGAPIALAERARSLLSSPATTA